MERAQQGHKISDEAWAVLAPNLPGQRGQWGRVARDNRQFLNGVLWILSTGAPWRDLPVSYGSWAATYRRFRRWQENGTWIAVYDILIHLPEFDWLKDVSNFRSRIQTTKNTEDARKGAKTE